jgi:hypothetical protein
VGILSCTEQNIQVILAVLTAKISPVHDNIFPVIVAQFSYINNRNTISYEQTRQERTPATNCLRVVRK